VVDNASGDGSIARIRQWAEAAGVSYLVATRYGAEQGQDGWLVLVEAEQNRGYAAGNNIGLDWIAAARDASHVWLLNPDIVVTPTALSCLLERMAAEPGIGTCGGLICDMEDRGRVQCYGGAGFRPWTARPFDLGRDAPASVPIEGKLVEQDLAYVMGACLLASREFLEAAGRMDERFFLYFEEISWQRRAGRRFRAGFAPAAVVYHRRHGAGGRQERWLFGNRLRFARWYQPWTLPSVALGLLGTAAASAFRGERERALMLLNPRFWIWAMFGKRPGPARSS
jgi:GT2 family glycosyltransferase